MIKYLLINMIITIASLAINHLMQIPHRIRFYLLMVAVVGWLIPFGLLAIELSPQTMQVLSFQLLQNIEPQAIKSAVEQSNWHGVTVFYVFVMIGLLRFGVDIFSSVKLIHQLTKTSKPYQNMPNLRLVQGINGAFVSGYFKPIIWLDESLLTTAALPSVIAHEKQHIKHNDQFWPLLISLVQRLFWFNPLVYLLCKKTSDSIELSCDEACKNLIGQNQYQRHLAQLTLVSHNTKQLKLFNSINHSPNFNINRIKQLNQENTMQTNQKIKLASVMGLAIMLCCYSLLTFAETEIAPSLEEGQVFVELKITVADQSTQELSLITTDQKLAEVKYDSYHLTIKPTIIKPPAGTNEQEALQILNELTLTQLNNQQSQAVLTAPSLVVLNKTWAGIKVLGETENEQVFIEIRTTVNSQDN